MRCSNCRNAAKFGILLLIAIAIYPTGALYASEVGKMINEITESGREIDQKYRTQYGNQTYKRLPPLEDPSPTYNQYRQPVADIYDKLNAQRVRAGLPPLTRNNQIDFRMLVRECNAGIRYSCVLARNF